MRAPMTRSCVNNDEFCDEKERIGEEWEGGGGGGGRIILCQSFFTGVITFFRFKLSNVSADIWFVFNIHLLVPLGQALPFIVIDVMDVYIYRQCFSHAFFWLN